MLLFPSITLYPKPLAFKSGYVVISGCADTWHHDIQDENGFVTGSHMNDKLKNINVIKLKTVIIMRRGETILPMCRKRF